MSDKIEDFLDRVCKKVKYKSIHTDIKQEFRSHIDESAQAYTRRGYTHESAASFAVSRMGDAEEIGDALNKEYRLPFNNKFGLAIWSALVTTTIYFLFPLLYKIFNNTIKVPNRNLVVLLSVLLFGMINFLYLKRSKLRMSLHDCLHITVGYLLGSVFSSIALLVSSYFFKLGYYPYFPDVKILFVTIPFVPTSLQRFALEFFTWWFCIIVYFMAVRNRNKKGFIFLARFCPTAYVDADKDIFN